MRNRVRREIAAWLDHDPAIVRRALDILLGG
jgi:hypothetical protein